MMNLVGWNRVIYLSLLKQSALRTTTKARFDEEDTRKSKPTYGRPKSHMTSIPYHSIFFVIRITLCCVLKISCLVFCWLCFFFIWMLRANIKLYPSALGFLDRKKNVWASNNIWIFFYYATRYVLKKRSNPNLTENSASIR